MIYAQLRRRSFWGGRPIGARLTVASEKTAKSSVTVEERPFRAASVRRRFTRFSAGAAEKARHDFSAACYSRAVASPLCIWALLGG